MAIGGVSTFGTGVEYVENITYWFRMFLLVRRKILDSLMI